MTALFQGQASGYTLYINYLVLPKRRILWMMIVPKDGSSDETTMARVVLSERCVKMLKYPSFDHAEMLSREDWSMRLKIFPIAVEVFPYHLVIEVDNFGLWWFLGESPSEVPIPIRYNGWGSQANLGYSSIQPEIAYAISWNRVYSKGWAWPIEVAHSSHGGTRMWMLMHLQRIQDAVRV